MRTTAARSGCTLTRIRQPERLDPSGAMRNSLMVTLFPLKSGYVKPRFARTGLVVPVLVSREPRTRPRRGSPSTASAAMRPSRDMLDRTGPVAMLTRAPIMVTL